MITGAVCFKQKKHIVMQYLRIWGLIGTGVIENSIFGIVETAVYLESLTPICLFTMQLFMGIR